MVVVHVAFYDNSNGIVDNIIYFNKLERRDVMELSSLNRLSELL